MRFITYVAFSLLLPFSSAYTQTVMTMSDAIVDFILFVDDAYLDQVPGKKGGCALVDHDTLMAIMNQSRETPTRVPGGSAVNMLKGLSSLGHECTLIATIGEDDAGQFYLDRLQQHGLRLRLQTTSAPTGKCVSLVTPNGERTMRTYLGNGGAAPNIDVNVKTFEHISLFHIEGYQLQHYALIRKIVKCAKQAGARISMDLASFETVRAHAPFIWELLRSHHIDLVFANKDEAAALTDLTPQEACAMLADYCPTVVVTLGEKGSLIQQGKEQLWHPAFSVSTVDTTAAGDLFIGGFLNGYLNGMPLKTCAWMGSLLASHVVQVVGSEIPSERWEMIHSALNKAAAESKELAKNW